MGRVMLLHSSVMALRSGQMAQSGRLSESRHAQIHSWFGRKGAELLETQWSEGDMRLRWRRIAKCFKLVILRPPLLWRYPQDVRAWIA